MQTVICSLTGCVTSYFCFSLLYDEGLATVPKLAENLTLELVHHIQVNAS